MTKYEEGRLLKKRRKALGKFFKMKRLEANLSQGKFAKLIKIGVSQNVSNIERGIAEYPSNVLPRVLHVLNIPYKTYISLVLEIENERLNVMLKKSMAKLKKDDAA